MSSERRAEAEQALVSAVLGRQPTRIEMEDILSSVPAGGVKSLGLSSVWDAMAKVHKAGAEVNILTVYDQMSADVQGRIADLPVQAVHLAEMSTTMYATAHGVAHWLAVVEKLNKVDDLKGKLVKGLADADAYEVDPDSLAQSLIHALEGGQEKVQHVTMAPLLQSIIADVESGTGAKPMPTPWANLNAVLKGGAAPGELVVLAARPGMGKTALAGCWAVETARNFGPVLFVSCEVKDKTLGSRMLAREGRIDNRAFREGLGNSMTLLPKMRNAADRLADLPLSIMDSSCRAVRPAEVRKWARKLGKPAMIVVDYLQLMHSSRNESRELEISDISRNLKALAKEMKVPVIALSQLNRKVEERTDKRPVLSDLRESGAIEQDADLIMFIHREDAYHKNKDYVRTGKAEIIIGKHRNGPTGTVELAYRPEFTAFDDLETSYIEPSESQAH